MNNYQILQEKSEFILAHDITNKLNAYGFDFKAFNEGIATSHRTLQQSFMRLIINAINFMASTDYRHDERNKAAHELAKKIKEFLDENGHGLSMI